MMRLPPAWQARATSPERDTGEILREARHAASDECTREAGGAGIEDEPTRRSWRWSRPSGLSLLAGRCGMLADG